VSEPGNGGSLGTDGTDGEPPALRHGWEAVRYQVVNLGVLGPAAVVVIGVGLDRAGYSAVGITITFLGGVAFIVMLSVLARWG
jgi:hypothetical protein